MTEVSSHFDRNEFACKCRCGQDTVDVELVTVLEKIRAHFNAPVSISSGNRCETYNQSVGGAKNSQHLKSRAADIQVRGFEPHEVQDWIDGWHLGGMGRYETFTHVDTRGKFARWG